MRAGRASILAISVFCVSGCLGGAVGFFPGAAPDDEAAVAAALQSVGAVDPNPPTPLEDAPEEQFASVAEPEGPVLGLWARLTGGDEPIAADPIPEVQTAALEDAEAIDEIELAEVDATPIEVDDAAPEDPAPRLGLWARLTGQNDEDLPLEGGDPPLDAEMVEELPADETPETKETLFAEVGPDDLDLTTDKLAEDEPQLITASATGGFLGRIFGGGSSTPPQAAQPAAVDIPDLGGNTALGFGQVARSCGVDAKSLGEEIDAYPKDRPTYRLYDTAPKSNDPRTLYITGFADGCPRRVTAALALFGSPEVHDMVRYGGGHDDVPFTTADRAYEDIRARICRVRLQRSCPRARMAELNASTVFVTGYDRFESAKQWVDILIHDGEVVASAFKSAGG